MHQVKKISRCIIKFDLKLCFLFVAPSLTDNTEERQVKQESEPFSKTREAKKQRSFDLGYLEGLISAISVPF